MANEKQQKSYWRPGDPIDPVANAERISDRRQCALSYAPGETIFAQLKSKIEDNITETQAVNASLKAGDQSLLRRAKSLSRSSGGFSELATFLTAVHNERPYVGGAVA